MGSAPGTYTWTASNGGTIVGSTSNVFINSTATSIVGGTLTVSSNVNFKANTLFKIKVLMSILQYFHTNPYFSQRHVKYV